MKNWQFVGLTNFIWILFGLSSSNNLIIYSGIVFLLLTILILFIELKIENLKMERERLMFTAIHNDLEEIKIILKDGISEKLIANLNWSPVQEADGYRIISNGTLRKQIRKTFKKRKKEVHHGNKQKRI